MSGRHRLPPLLLLLLVQGLARSSAEEESLTKCCGMGMTWATQGLRCETFTGPVPGVPKEEQTACIETIDICCRKQFQDEECKKGKADAKAGLECTRVDTGPRRAPIGSGESRRDCCEGCKLGIMTGSRGKGCSKKISLGAPWDPAFTECCLEKISSTTKDSSSTAEITSPSTSSTADTTPESFEFDDESDEIADSTTSVDLCKVMKGLLCSEICVTTPGSYYCKCREGQKLLADGKTCESNTTTTATTMKSTMPTTLETTTKTTKTAAPTTSTTKLIKTPKATTTTRKPTTKKTTTTKPPKSTPKPTTTTPKTTTTSKRKTTPKRATSKSTTTVKPTTTSKPTTTVKPTTTPKSTSTVKATTTTASSTTITTTKPENSKNSTKNEATPKSKVASKETTIMSEKKTTLPMSPAASLKVLTTAGKSRTTRSIPTEDNELNLPCPAGYRFTPGTESCDDIDECSEKPVPCPPGSGCLNTNGSYHCFEAASYTPEERCEFGYRWNDTSEQCVDVDECSENTHKCLVDSEICKNLVGSYECEVKCERGFIFNGNFGACLDINECIELTNVCLQPDTICINTLGSYECKNIIEYQQVNEPNLAGNGTDERQSSDYDNIDEGDIDECEVVTDACAPGETCRNTVGGYDCVPTGCPRGFALLNELCQDVNECAEGLHSCSPLETCRNINGSFVCEPPRPTRPATATEPTKILCRKGYKADNVTDGCVDVDECTEGPGCREHERCVNLQGSYDCYPLCGPGWYFEPHTKSCQDVDECLLGRHNCRQRTHYCLNTNGSFSCEGLAACEPGYRRGQNGSCLDVDECAEGVHTCSRELYRYCANRPGGYECISRLPQCPPGFEFSLLTRRCDDVDECRGGGGSTRPSCSPGERCVNLPGSYRCERPAPELRAQHARRPACPSGFSYDPALRKCSDIDECAERSHNCGTKKCYNLPGTFQCAKVSIPVTRRKPTTPRATSTRSTSALNSCSTGFRYSAEKGGCSDVNECEELEDACASNEVCTNSVGSFGCECAKGFRRDELTLACVDVNECQLENDCLSSQRCDNTIGSYTCVRFLPCGTGYTLNAATEICEDDDECALGTHDCNNGYHCRNTIGSYRCDKDRPPKKNTTPRPTARAVLTTFATRRTTTPRPTTTTPKPTTTTPTPTTTTSRVAMKPTTIRPNTTTRSSLNPTTPSRPNTTRVVPTVGSITTPTRSPKLNATRARSCPRGFESGPIGQCIDIDECRRNLKMCGSQRCVNTIGSFRCEPGVLCGVGYASDPVTGACKDLNECLDGTHKCSRDQKCENRYGGYVCVCPPGYEVGKNHECVDTNECAVVLGGRICGGHGRCVNTPGSYRCECDEGFSSDPTGGGCQDRDECRERPGICQQLCYNTWGGHRCACRPGYRLKPDNRSCDDVDECAEFKGNHLCVGICDNTPGSYVCRCPDGYVLSDDARTCQDIDECASGNVCTGQGELCQNVRGGFRCNKVNCPPGYIHDPLRKNRCMRESPYCPVDDLACFQRPAHYTYNYIAIVSMFPIPASTGRLELFTMRGAYNLPGSTASFSMVFVGARAPPHVPPATESCFALRRPSPSQADLVMTKSLQGPQDIQLEISMEIYAPNGQFAGNAIAKIFIIITQYEF